MPSPRPNQRTNAGVSACNAGLTNHREHHTLERSLVGDNSGINILECGLVDHLIGILREYGLVDHLIDIGRDPVPSI